MSCVRSLVTKHCSLGYYYAHVTSPHHHHASHLVKLKFDAAVSGHVHQRQLVQRRQQQLHVRQPGLQHSLVTAAQGRVQPRVQARFLRPISADRQCQTCATGQYAHGHLDVARFVVVTAIGGHEVMIVAHRHGPECTT